MQSPWGLGLPLMEEWRQILRRIRGQSRRPLSCPLPFLERKSTTPGSCANSNLSPNTNRDRNSPLWGSQLASARRQAQGHRQPYHARVHDLPGFCFCCNHLGFALPAPEIQDSKGGAQPGLGLHATEANCQVLSPESPWPPPPPTASAAMLGSQIEPVSPRVYPKETPDTPSSSNRCEARFLPRVTPASPSALAIVMASTGPLGAPLSSRYPSSL